MNEVYVYVAFAGEEHHQKCQKHQFESFGLNTHFKPPITT